MALNYKICICLSCVAVNYISGLIENQQFPTVEMVFSIFIKKRSTVQSSWPFISFFSKLNIEILRKKEHFILFSEEFTSDVVTQDAWGLSFLTKIDHGTCSIGQ